MQVQLEKKNRLYDYLQFDRYYNVDNNIEVTNYLITTQTIMNMSGRRKTMNNAVFNIRVIVLADNSLQL